MPRWPLDSRQCDRATDDGGATAGCVGGRDSGSKCSGPGLGGSAGQHDCAQSHGDGLAHVRDPRMLADRQVRTIYSPK